MKTSLLAVMLSGCVQASCRPSYNDMPEFPKAGVGVADNVERVCEDQDCEELNRYFNELYLFKNLHEVYINLNNREK